MNKKTEVSVVVPVFNETRNLKEFFSELDGKLVELGKSYEVIFVDDGSTDDSYKILLDIQECKVQVKVLSLKNNVGKGGALEQGFKLVSGDKVIIMDCDLQYDPSDIKLLLHKLEEGYDAVSGKRVSRVDFTRVILSSWVFRFFIRKLSGLNFSDFFSGLKCFKAPLISQFGIYGDLNRIFTVYAYRAGYKVCEIPINHRARRHGRSKYNFLDRLRLAVRDLIVLFYTVVVTREELYKIGLIGFFFLGCGTFFFVIAIFMLSFEMLKSLLESLLFLFGVLFIFVGFQLRIIETIGKEFLDRHMGAPIFKDHSLRMANVKYISPDKEELFSQEWENQVSK